MGVPKFYRWISERYPCLSEVVKENQIPEFDNLYLDMNGIIHPCSHPNDDDVHFRITEEKIYENIFHYIEVLFRIIRPRKVFFMAVDGVAPRAKMNQQRGRRFRSAHEAEAREKEAVRKGETLPEEKRFDSNCITPGTHFMARLNEQLKYFVNQKISQDKSWQGLRIYLSGHETPGEGEHKIMDFIRSEKLRQDYDANTRHCLYGLDADLIMLGLASHEPHFSLLREEVRFGKQANNKRPTTAEETTFHLLHLSLFREYLDAEFAALKPKLTNYDAEKIIDDWVFMGFLVGNDFVPHLPDLHINHNALPLLYQTYIEVRPQMDGYINDNGTLKLRNFEMYITKLSQFDRDKFEEQFVDLSYFSGKKETNKGEAWQSERVKAKKEAEQRAKNLDNSFAALMGLEDDPDWPDSTSTPGAAVPASIPVQQHDDGGNEDDEEDLFEIEFRQHKADYYRTKFGVDNISRSQKLVIAEEYVRAMQWILHYYFNGIQSWGWYYPYHYAPYMSDLRDFSNMKLDFDKGEPFLPFQQLLGVLPAASRECLPEAYQSLMIMDNSPIIDYYPVEFEQDLNGKQQAWEAVVLIPFIDEKRLLAAMAPCDTQLTEEERGRNKHSPHLLYTYDENLNFKYPTSCAGHFPDIVACHARCKEIHKMAFQHDPSKLQRGLRKGVKLGIYFPGFPTLHHLDYTTELSKQEVKVFQQNSRGDNMMLNIITKNAVTGTYELDAAAVANDVLGKGIFAEWPHLKEVRVIAVAAVKDEYRYELVESVQKGSKATEQRTIKRVAMTEDDRIQWIRDVKQISETYHKRKGVRIGRTDVLVYACPLMGRRYICGHSGVITLEKQWSSNPVPYAYQVTVKDIAVHDASFKQFKTLAEIFPKDSDCFMLATPNYGCQGKVQEVEDGRVRVIFTIPYEPTFDHIKRNMDQYETQYFPAYVIAKRLAVSSHLVSRITGTIFMEKGSKEDSIYSPGIGNRIPIGLNLKFNRTNHEIPGYTKKDNGTWLYSTKLEQVLREYIQKFPELFQFISKNVSEDTFYELDIFGENGQRLKDLQDWLKALDCSKVGKVQSGHNNLGETAVKLIENDLIQMMESKKKGVRKMKMFVRPHLLYKPLEDQGNLIPDPEAEYQLFDRVVNVREGYTVPLGLKGIVIGVQQSVNVLDSLYDVVFDEEFPGGLTLRCSGTRAYRMPPTSLINISFGLRKEAGVHRGDKPTAVVKPQFSASPQAQHTQSPVWYSNMMGKIGSTNTSGQGGQRSRGQVSAKNPGYQYTPRNQRSNARASIEATPETFYTPRTQFETTPYFTPYQSTPPAETQNNYRSHGKNASQRQNQQQDSPSFTLLTKTGTKKVHVGQPSKDNIQAIPMQKQESQSLNRPAAKESGRPIIEGSSHNASVQKGVSKTSNESKKTQRLPKETIVAEVDEFANLWKQLQASDSDNSAPDTPARNTSVQPEESNDDTSMQTITSDIPLKPKAVTDVMLNEEDRMSPRTYAKSGTEELCRILNITGISDTTKEEPTPACESSSVEVSPKSDLDATPSYGVPLTLDELFSGVFPSKEPASPGTLPTSPHPPMPAGSTQQPIHPGLNTLPINIPSSRPAHPYPISPIPSHSHSPQTPPRQVQSGLIAGHPIVALGGSPLIASSSGSSVSSTGSPAVSNVHGQPNQLSNSTDVAQPTTPHTPPRTYMQHPIAKGSPIQGQNVVTSQQMLQGVRGPSPHQGPPQQFRMHGPTGSSAAVLRGPPMVNRGPLPPNMFPGPTYSKMLLDWCWQHRMPRPQFEFFPNQKTGTIRAAVHLPNGPRFMGPDGVNQHAAADMVAHMFLRHLDPAKFAMSGMRGPIQGPPPPHGSPRQPPPPHGSPRQPPPPHGSPHQTPPPHIVAGQALPSHGSPMQGQPGPRYPVFPDKQMVPRPIRPTIGPSGVGAQWSGMQAHSTAPSHLGSPLVAQGPGSSVPSSQVSAPQVVFHAQGPNPFVPLQVTRQLTPRKNSSLDEESDPVTSPRDESKAAISNSTGQVNTTAVVSPRNPGISTTHTASQEKESHKVEEKKIAVEEGDRIIERAEEDKPKKVRPRRMPSKAKLAINFGN